MREKAIEHALVMATRSKGGIALKFTSPGFAGMPDRLVLLPHGRMGFVELKAPGRKPRPLQLARHRLLRRLGFKVYVIDDTRQIAMVLKEIGGDALLSSYRMIISSTPSTLSRAIRLLPYSLIWDLGKR